MVAPRARGKAHVFEGLVGHDKLVLLGAAHRCAAGCRLTVSDLVVPVRMRVTSVGPPKRTTPKCRHTRSVRQSAGTVWDKLGRGRGANPYDSIM